MWWDHSQNCVVILLENYEKSRDIQLQGNVINMSSGSADRYSRLTRTANSTVAVNFHIRWATWLRDSPTLGVKIPRLRGKTGRLLDRLHSIEVRPVTNGQTADCGYMYIRLSWHGSGNYTSATFRWACAACRADGRVISCLRKKADESKDTPYSQSPIECRHKSQTETKFSWTLKRAFWVSMDGEIQTQGQRQSMQDEYKYHATYLATLLQQSSTLKS